MEQLKVMIVDDSAVVRGLISQMLEECDGIDVVGTAANGQLALSQLNDYSVDVMILDYMMPVLDGLETAAQLQQSHPEVETIFISAKSRLTAATDIGRPISPSQRWLEKPEAANAADSIHQMQSQLVEALKEINFKRKNKQAEVNLNSAIDSLTRQNELLQRIQSPTQAPEAYDGHPKLLVIGSSTGGPQALRTVLTSLPEGFDLPILITQHMPPNFTSSLAKHIARDTGRDCREGVDGERIQRNRIYIAPGDYHMTVEKRNNAMCIGLNQEPQEHHCRPSVNQLFRTASAWYGSSLMGAMLTGMGEDGIEGTHELVGRGGYMLAQDEQSSVVWGMPAAVVRHGLAHDICPLDCVAIKLSQVANILEQKV